MGPAWARVLNTPKLCYVLTVHSYQKKSWKRLRVAAATITINSKSHKHSHSELGSMMDGEFHSSGMDAEVDAVISSTWTMLTKRRMTPPFLPNSTDPTAQLSVPPIYNNF